MSEQYAARDDDRQPLQYPPMQAPRNGLGTAALVLGIVGIPLALIPIVGAILGILAIVFGVIGRQRASRGEATNGRNALIGAILGAVAIVLSIIVGYAAFDGPNSDTGSAAASTTSTT